LAALMPLVYRDKGTTGTQLAIYSHELCIGHVGKELMTGSQSNLARWRWTFWFQNTVPKGFPIHGFADTLEEAKAIIEAAWKDWLTAAGLSERAREPG